MVKKKIGIIFTIVSVLVAIILSGCAKPSEPTIANTDNTNQSVTVLDSANINTAVDSPNNSVRNNAAQNVNTTTAPTLNTAPPNNTAIAPPVNKKPAPPNVKEPEPQIGSGGSDLLLVIQARNVLSAEKKLLDTVVVDSKEGNVTLTGKVSSAAEKAKAAQLVQGVKGVKSVKNNITVSQ